MRIHARSLPLALSASLAVLVALGACAARGPSAATPRAARIDRTVLMREQLISGRYVNVYDAVAALRSFWLRPRGPDSFMLQTTVWVYLDEGRFGTVETLRSLQPRLITSVRFYDGPSATGRWGVGHNAGVIHVSTWSTGALGFPGTVRVDPDSASAQPDSTAPPDSATKPMPR